MGQSVATASTCCTERDKSEDGAPVAKYAPSTRGSPSSNGARKSGKRERSGKDAPKGLQWIGLLCCSDHTDRGQSAKPLPFQPSSQAAVLEDVEKRLARLESRAVLKDEGEDSFGPGGMKMPKAVASANHHSLHRGRPNFTGKWVLCAVTGEVEEFLVDEGASMLLRKAARVVGWGVERVTLDIVQNAECIISNKVSAIGEKLPSTLKFDDERIRCQMDLGPALASVTLQSDHMRYEVEMIDSGNPPRSFTVIRSLQEDGTFVDVCTSHKGHIMNQVYRGRED
mmetsp:Transcript_45383/g.82932  ORF Transcript_45383/g.82932 Transcript_45383/m.82932 type:complete len:283 (-) Transcript_45383:103-951(-)